MTVKLHPEILRKNGKKKFVVLPYEEFLAIQEALSDAEDLLELRLAKKRERDKPAISLRDVRKKLGIS